MGGCVVGSEDHSRDPRDLDLVVDSGGQVSWSETGISSQCEANHVKKKNEASKEACFDLME